MATAVITIRPFATFDRSAHDTFSLEWAIRAITSGEFAPDHNLFCQLPEFTPASPSKPHWFKRLYDNALARFTLSVRVSQEVAAKLKSIIGWHDKLRRYMDTIAKNFLQTPDYYSSVVKTARIPMEEEHTCYFLRRFSEEIDKKANIQLVKKQEHQRFCDAYDIIWNMVDGLEFFDEFSDMREKCLDIKNRLPNKGIFMGTMLIVAARLAKETTDYFTN